MNEKEQAETVAHPKCWVCDKHVSEGELWYRMLDAQANLIATVCGGVDVRHVKLEADLRREIQGEQRVVLMDAFIPTHTHEEQKHE